MPGEHIQIVNAPDVISMEDDPSTATRKKPESSMAVALQMLHRGEGDAVISAGSTGALLSGATLTVRRIRGIRRACFGPVIPNGGKGTLLIDCGANVECTAEYLLQFAYARSSRVRRSPHRSFEYRRGGDEGNGASEADLCSSEGSSRSWAA